MRSDHKLLAEGYREIWTDPEKRANRDRDQQRLRCEESGHDWVNCCSFTFEIYQRCKWCGQRR